MKQKNSSMGRVAQLITGIIFIAAFLYLMFIVAIPIALQAGLID